MTLSRSWLPILAICLLSSSCISRLNPPPVARHGQIDLSNWDLQKDGNLALDGEWEFYWGQLLDPKAFSVGTTPTPTGYAVVPDSWNQQTIGGKTYPRDGYATYRLVLRKISDTGLLALKILDFSSSYRLWVNGRLLASNGVVSANPDSAVPQYLPLAPLFQQQGDSIQLVVQVCNFFHRDGGIWTSILVGTADQITEKRDAKRALQCGFAAAMFILFIYHIMIFLLRRKEWGAFWFAMLCIDTCLRMLFTNERLFYEMFPGFPLSIGLRFEYLTVTVGVPIYVMVAHEFFPNELPKKVRNAIMLTGIVESLLICVFPAKIYTQIITLVQLIVLLQCCYLMFVVIRALMNRRDFALISFIIYIVQFVAIVNDILYARLIINGEYLLTYAFLAFLLVQAYILAYRYTVAFDRAEDLSVELNAANMDLERKVEERTRELQGTNGQLRTEKQKAEELLLNILPAEIAEELKDHGHSKARRYPSITVMFTDFKNFTMVSEELTPEQLVREIDHCYRAFDDITARYGLEKIKTMGDSYICAGGLPKMNFTHPEDVVNAALEIRDFMDAYCTERRRRGEPVFDIRIGVHTGPAVAGIVGARKFAYDIWGDTVNLAARMESSGEVGKVNISQNTWQMVKDKFNCLYRGKISAKNKGEIDMYFADRIGERAERSI